jgi:hypothetical protein
MQEILYILVFKSTKTASLCAYISRPNFHLTERNIKFKSGEAQLSELR